MDPWINLSTHVSSAMYNYCGTEILGSYFENDIYLFDVNEPPNSYLNCYHSPLNMRLGIKFYYIIKL